MKRISHPHLRMLSSNQHEWVGVQLGARARLAHTCRVAICAFNSFILLAEADEVLEVSAHQHQIYAPQPTTNKTKHT